MVVGWMDVILLPEGLNKTGGNHIFAITSFMGFSRNSLLPLRKYRMNKYFVTGASKKDYIRMF